MNLPVLDFPCQFFRCFFQQRHYFVSILLDQSAHGSCGESVRSFLIFCQESGHVTPFPFIGKALQHTGHDPVFIQSYIFTVSFQLLSSFLDTGVSGFSTHSATWPTAPCARPVRFLGSRLIGVASIVFWGYAPRTCFPVALFLQGEM